MTRDVPALVRRYNELLGLKRRVDSELAQIDITLRIEGALPPRRGRPQIPTRQFSDDELRGFHRRYVAGERSPEIREGERAYQRTAKRRRRARLREAS